MPLLTTSHNYSQPAKPKQVQLLTQDSFDSPCVKENQEHDCAGNLSSVSDSPIHSLAMNFASNARLNSPLNSGGDVVSKLDFDSPDWLKVTPTKGVSNAAPFECLLEEVSDCVISNDDENIHCSSANNKNAQNKKGLSESKKSKRNKMSTLSSRPRSCLSEMTNIVTNRLQMQNSQLEVRTDFYENDFHGKHRPISPSPIGPNAENSAQSVKGSDSLDTIAENSSSKCLNSKRALSFHSVSFNASKPDWRKLSCPLELPTQPIKNRKQPPEDAETDSDFAEILNSSFQLLSPTGISTPPKTDNPTSGSSAAISALLTAPILSIPSQKSTQVVEENPQFFLSPPFSKLRFSCHKRVSESSSETESRKRVSPHCNWRESPDAKRKRLALSPKKCTTEAIPKLTPLKIGDESREHILPLVRGKQPNLASISGDTLVKVLQGEFDHFLESRLIVDCRYPYEFEGGHIKEAVNLWTKEMCHKKFFPAQPVQSRSEAKPQIIIFHCEFSSHRAPKMYEFIRETDRRVNGEQYPKLDYPEIYLLHAGYREFFKLFSDFCFPRNYIEMNDEKYKEDMKKCRIKSKTCDNEMRSRGTKSRLLLMNRSNTCML